MGGSSKSLLDIVNVSKYYSFNNASSLKVLRNINLEIKEGDFVCIVGPNGCGKTTLLKIIANLIPASSGKIVHKKPQAPTANIVLQEKSLLPWLTIVDNLALGLSARGFSQKDGINFSIRALQQAGLGEFIRQYPNQLSVGMRQRISIMRVFLTQSELVLMDEPFSSLDSQVRYVLQDELINYWKSSNSAVIFVTHDIREAIKLANRIVVLSMRPASLIADIKVELPRPRQMDGRKAHDLFRKIWGLLERDIRSSLLLE